MLLFKDVIVLEKILVLNTGGTFNKIYNEIGGKLIIPKDNLAIEKIIKTSFKGNEEIYIKGLIYKDSLEFTISDRKYLLNEIKNSRYKQIIVIHGTDTMEKSANYIAKKIKNKTIIFVGAMRPFSCDPIEATANFCTAYGFLQNNKKAGIYISMHGLVKKYNKIKKNRELGIFECRK